MEEKSITLKQGLEKFYEDYRENLSHKDDGLPDEVRHFFKSHDIAHVLFGCDISLFGEGSVKMWTIFGTTLGFWKHIEEYRKANAFELAKNFEPVSYLSNLLKLMCAIPLLILRAKKMNRPWPWAEYENYLDTPIFKIREEFNIRVLK
ncbi:hypothetical protein CEQ90_02265 [Lewinellaceae bacterium SD302]|nr:hypothetical protein CEQ90_02265 [Lewinellaceae bacterium SD302]